MSFTIEELVLDNDSCPFREWLESLDKKTQARVDARISRFEQGNFGDSKSLGDKLFEARIFLGPGYRIYFGKIKNQVILLISGGDKSTQKRDISKAKELLKQYLEEQNANEKS